MGDVKAAKRISGYSSISEGTKESLFRLISALVLVLVCPKITFLIQSALATDGSDPSRFGMAIAFMAMPLVVALLWSANVLRQEKNVWKSHHQRHSRPFWRLVKRLLYLALLFCCPACVALIIWHLIYF